MLIWYRNSILASIISLIGCAGVVAGISELFKDPAMREMSVPETIGFIAAGVLFAILGKVISVNKDKKKRAKAAATQAASAPVQSAPAGVQPQVADTAQPVQTRTVQQTPAFESSLVAQKPIGKSVSFARFFYLLATLFGLWGFYLYNQLRRTYGSRAEFGTIGFDRLSVLLFLASVVYLLLMFACSATKRKQAVSALYAPGFLGLIAIHAEDAVRCYRAYGFGGYIANDGSTYYAMISVPLLRIAAFLLMTLFAFFAMKNAKERYGGLVRALWFVPFVLLALAFVKACSDSYLFDLVSSTLFREDVRLTLRPEYLDMLSQLCMILAVLFTGFCFRGLCCKAQITGQQTVYAQSVPQDTVSAPVQSAPAYEQPRYTAPVQPVEASQAYQPQYTAPVQPKPEPQQETAPTAAQTTPQDVEKQMEAYRDLLECGILTQEEYEQEIRKIMRG